MPPIRKDAVGRVQTAHSWESLVERQIREAMEAGEFENLPHAGAPIAIDDDGSEAALVNHILRQAGFAPGWIATDAEIRKLLARRDALILRARRAGTVRERDRVEMGAIVREVNALVLRLEHEAPTSRQHRRRLDLAQELLALEQACSGEDPSGGESPDRR